MGRVMLFVIKNDMSTITTKQAIVIATEAFRASVRCNGQIADFRISRLLLVQAWSLSKASSMASTRPSLSCLNFAWR